MNILRSFKRTRFFLCVNIIGLALGLAVSIMLLLFVVNELSYDRHFANHERIVRLNSIAKIRGEKKVYSINLRKAYTELPSKVSGIESTTQIYKLGKREVIIDDKHFQNVEFLCVDPEFFEVFQMKFIEGTARDALSDANSTVITRKQSGILFGEGVDAVGKSFKVSGKVYNVSAVVEELPLNTHFSFGVLVNTKSESWLDKAGGLEFYTYYLIDRNASFEGVRESIEKEYSQMLEVWGASFSEESYGTTEKLTDVYLHTQAVNNLGSRNSMTFVWLLTVLSVLILLLAIANFINLFIAQGETRMHEIGIRKANGARIQDIVRQFFIEVSFIVFISFVLGFFLMLVLVPYFSELVDKRVDLIQLLNPWFVVCLIILFIVTVVLSAFYPSFYLSRFTPLDILGKHLKFSKRRLTIAIVVFQSVITIVLMSYIWMINRQVNYLENISLGYNPKNVVEVWPGMLGQNYDALRQELLALPEIEQVSGSGHTIGGGTSGQGIGPLEDMGKSNMINEYRIKPGFCELIGFELLEGESFKESTHDSIGQIMLNEAAVKMLDLRPPVAGQFVNYKGHKVEVIGVVKDFYYDELTSGIEPIALAKPWAWSIYMRVNENVSRREAEEAITDVFRKFDESFVVNPIWLEDVYVEKFQSFKTQGKIVLTASLLSMFIAMLGLVAVHLYAVSRRMKEIALRRISGATSENIFTLLSYEIVKWVVIAGLVAMPFTYYVLTEWLNNFTNRSSLSWTVFVIPLLIQCIIAIVVTSGVTWRVLSQNPVDSLKTE